MTEKPGIYAIRCNGKVYIGSATNISKRWSRHRKDLRADQHPNTHLQAAWNKYGESAFEFTVLEFTGGDFTELREREQYWIDATGCADRERGYNKCPQARSSRGRPSEPYTPERRAALKGKTKGKSGFGISLPPMVGADNHATKLTNKQVRAIKERLAIASTLYPNRYDPRRRPHSYTVLAREYGVKVATIEDIAHGRTWRNV